MRGEEEGGGPDLHGNGVSVEPNSDGIEPFDVRCAECGWVSHPDNVGLHLRLTGHAAGQIVRPAVRPSGGNR